MMQSCAGYIPLLSQSPTWPAAARHFEDEAEEVTGRNMAGLKCTAKQVKAEKNTCSERETKELREALQLGSYLE